MVAVKRLREASAQGFIGRGIAVEEAYAALGQTAGGDFDGMDLDAGQNVRDGRIRRIEVSRQKPGSARVVDNSWQVASRERDSACAVF